MTATVDTKQKGILFYEAPLSVDRYKFLYEHLDCDSIIEKSDDDNNISVIAYAIAKEFNRSLRLLFYENGYEGKYDILRGIDSREVNSID